MLEDDASGLLRFLCFAEVWQRDVHLLDDYQ